MPSPSATEARARTLAWRELDGFVVLAMGPSDPSREGWDEFLASNERKLSTGRRIAGVLVFPIGTAGPNAGQRQQLKQQLERHRWRGPVAMVVGNPLALTVARLVALTGENLRPFGLSGFDDALAHVGLTPRRDEVLRIARELVRELSRGALEFSLPASR